MAYVEIRQVEKKFGFGEREVSALRGVDIEIEQGEFVCIMGTSGSGKTTLLQLLGGLDFPTSGEVIINQINISQVKEKELAHFRRRKVGFVFQQFNLIPVLTAEENVALPLLIDNKSAKKAKRQAAELLKLVGLEERKQHLPSQLSGGQQQRVAIARALSMKPSILLADEPTGALDSKTSFEIIRLLRSTCDQLKQTSIVVTHEPSVAAYADRILILTDGKVVDDIYIETPWYSRDIPKQLQQIQAHLNNHFEQKELMRS